MIGPGVLIRAEIPADVDAVRRVNEAAFGRPEEARLVDALRRAAVPHVSLVAVLDGETVGHIFFSPVSVESGEGTWPAMGLAPMAVAPRWQRTGIGSQLVRRGLDECLTSGADVVVVLGHADYYPRFGFVPASRMGLRSEYDVPDEVFLVAELRPGALAGRTGLVKYRPEFASV